MTRPSPLPQPGSDERPARFAAEFERLDAGAWAMPTTVVEVDVP